MNQRRPNIRVRDRVWVVRVGMYGEMGEGFDSVWLSEDDADARFDAIMQERAVTGYPLELLEIPLGAQLNGALKPYAIRRYDKQMYSGIMSEWRKGNK